MMIKYLAMKKLIRTRRFISKKKLRNNGEKKKRKQQKLCKFQILKKLKIIINNLVSVDSLRYFIRKISNNVRFEGHIDALLNPFNII